MEDKQDQTQAQQQPIVADVTPVNVANSSTPNTSEPPETKSLGLEADEPSSPPESEDSSEPKQKKEGGILSFIATLIIAFILVQVINLFFFQSYKVFGSSMFPTLHDGDRLIISKIGKTTSKIRGADYQPKRGDIIVFIDPKRSDLQLIKRVIGLPGERVIVKDGKLTVFNTEHPQGFNPDDADYGKDLPKTSGSNDVSIPKGELFVSGDNREGSNSLDSRNELGTVPERLVIGTLKVRIWPFDGAKFF